MSTFERVASWNEFVGKTTEEVGTAQYWLSLANQAERIKEELEELYEAINNKDIEGVVDAGADLDVVVSGLNFLAGSDYPEVINAVLCNNDLKYTTILSKAKNWLQYHLDNGVDAYLYETTSRLDGLTRYCVKRKEDDKVLKYGNFPKVDITDHLPEPVEEVFTLVKTKEEIEEAKERLPNEVLSLESLEGDQIDFFENLLNEHKEVQIKIVNGALVSIDTPEEES